MLSTLIICLTVIVCLFTALGWITYMVKNGLPIFTWGQYVCKDESVEEHTDIKHIGFQSEPENPETKPTDKELKEAIMREPTALISTLLRGEIDFDELGQ